MRKEPLRKKGRHTQLKKESSETDRKRDGSHATQRRRMTEEKAAEKAES